MSVNVVRERSDQRRHHRVTAPLFVVLDGHKLKATDWSLGGLRLDDFPGELPGLGTTVKLNISIPFQGFDVAFDCEAEVARRIEASRTLAFKYTRISNRELGLMEHFIDELIRGSMVDVKDTIQRIDVPVTPASTNPDPNPLAKIPISRWPTKTIAFVALYLTIGLFVFGYAGVIAYTNFVRMEVDSAVIASPIESVRAQVNGRIVYGKYRQGDHVPKGALLLSMVDNDLERQIDLASIDIKDKAAQLSASDRQLKEEIARVDAFARVEGKNLDQIDLEVQSLEAQAKAAQALHQRMDHLFKQGFTTATIVESAEKQMISSRALAESKRLELQTRRSLATDNAGSRLYNGQSFSGDRVKVEAQNFLARENVATAEKKLQALLDHRDRLAVYAPYAGMLQELPRADNSMVRVGDTIAVVENPKAREIWAFLRQDEVLSVGLDDEVKVYLPGLSELRKARVMRIDRTIGFVNEMNSTYIWRAPRDRSAKVIMEFIDVGARPEDENYRTGMPAVAIFSTRPTNYLIGDMAHRFRMVFGGRARKPAEDKLATRARKEPPVEDTPGTADKDRLGPPRNYVSSGNAMRDPDAVTARRTELALAPRRLPDAPDVAAVKPAASEPPPAGLMERFADSFADLRRQLLGLLPRGDEPVPRKQHAVAEPAAPSPKLPPQQKSPAREQAPHADAPSAANPSAQAGKDNTRAAAASKPERMAPPPAPVPPPAGEADDDADEPAPRGQPKATPAGNDAPQGYFERLKERLRALFRPKPEDDDDWGDDNDIAAAAAAPKAVSTPAPAAARAGDRQPVSPDAPGEGAGTSGNRARDPGQSPATRKDPAQPLPMAPSRGRRPTMALQQPSAADVFQPNGEAMGEPSGEGVQLVRQIDSLGLPTEPDLNQDRALPARQAPVALPAPASPAGAATQRPSTGQSVWQARMRRGLATEKRP